MSMLLDFIGGAADEWKRQLDDKEKRRLDYIDRKREMAERQRLAAAERKARRAERIEEREWDKEDRREELNDKVIETYQSGGSLIERLGDGTIRTARALSAEELEDRDLKRRQTEAMIGAYGRGGRGGRDDEESAYKVDADEALNILGFRSEEELESMAETAPEVFDMYSQIKGRRLTQTQKDELRSRFRARAEAARRRNALARGGAIIFDEGTGTNLADMDAALLTQIRAGK